MDFSLPRLLSRKCSGITVIKALMVDACEISPAIRRYSMAQGAMPLELPALSTAADACEHSRATAATAATATARAVMNCVKAKPLEKICVKNRKS